MQKSGTGAVFLATGLEGIKYWVRNVERKPSSFSLQTATDKFYPDFICKLNDGRILVVEYKSSRDYDLPDNEEKRRLGALWELHKLADEEKRVAYYLWRFTIPVRTISPK